MMNKLDIKSENIVDDNIEYIREKFPNVVVESDKGYAIDFNTLKQELSDVIVDETKEKYQLTWPGKKEAIVTANTPTTKTLRPVREKSGDFDNTENIYIEGDNLEVLKILQESYLNKIKCIYIDPPYNTGNDFIYNDNFDKEKEQELLETGQIDEFGNRLVSNNQSNGRFHSDWLSMMYPRLKLARNLLTDNGVIFISIDDNEMDNLKKICDEIFGEKNFVATFLWTKTSTPPSLSNKTRKTVEYVLCYEKNYSDFKYYGSKLDNGDAPLLNSGNPIKDLIFPEKTVKFNMIENGVLDVGKYDKVEVIEKCIIENGTNKNPLHLKAEFKWTQERLNYEIANGTYFLIKSDKLSIRFQRKENEESYKTPTNFINLENIELNKNNNITTNESAVKELEELGVGSVFSYPKPTTLISYLINMILKNDKNGYVLDFFSGSATTAHSLMKLNAVDNGNRKYIMVQLPEKIEEKFDTICDLGEERIRKAASKIKEETNADIDYGFRVYKIDSSNMKDVYYKPDELNQEQLNLFETNIKDDRTSEDLLTQVILDLGLTLDLKIEEKNILGNKVYFVDSNSLVACFDDDLNINIIDEICKYKPLKVVFKDNSFENDNDKINVEEKIKKLSPETELNIL